MRKLKHAVVSKDRADLKDFWLAGYPQTLDPIVTLDVNHGVRYHLDLIRSFKCAYTEALSKGHRVR